MKIKGASIPAPSPVEVTFYRGQDVVKLRLQAVLSFEQFNRLVPTPKPPLKTDVKNNRQWHDYEDKGYEKKLDQYSELKSAYVIIKGLEATDGLEWENVNINEPDTWVNYKKELLQSFTETESARIIDAVNEANNPTTRRIEEAFDSFTPSQDQQVTGQAQSSQEGEQPVTQSGEPVKGSE